MRHLRSVVTFAAGVLVGAAAFAATLVWLIQGASR